MPMLVVLSWLPDIKSLAPLSAFAIGANFLGQFVVYAAALRYDRLDRLLFIFMPLTNGCSVCFFHLYYAAF